MDSMAILSIEQGYATAARESIHADALGTVGVDELENRHFLGGGPEPLHTNTQTRRTIRSYQLNALCTDDWNRDIRVRLSMACMREDERSRGERDERGH